ncbi:MAG TPA: acyloxyacyl hydrolase [Acidobacteriaceae bacterium]|nr:acyloxyacyl hydrolase [Acidobacteriaceae bacterium]
MTLTSATPLSGRSNCAAPVRALARAAALIMLLVPAALVAQQTVVSSPPTRASGWQGPGGRHEVGLWWGYSGFSGDIWGASHSVTYMPTGIRYSYEFARHNQLWSVRYSPEITPFAAITWLQPDVLTNVVSGDSPRLRSTGGGISPVGFRLNLHPLAAVQPFFSTNEGFIYFRDRVLSAQGSQWMYTIDFGAGLNIYHHRNQAVTIGYRYQHLSNANISFHNPGTDANTFYFGVSRFLNKGE